MMTEEAVAEAIARRPELEKTGKFVIRRSSAVTGGMYCERWWLVEICSDSDRGWADHGVSDVL